MQRNQTATMAERLLTIRETAARLDVSGRQIYKLCASGRFGPALVRIGRSVRIRESDLENWIALGCPSREQFQAAQARRVEEVF
jgi:excisionase family DNA binding protein